MEDGERIISKAAFAERAGVVRSRVTAWIEAGMPTAGRKIDVLKAEAWLQDNIDRARREQSAAGTFADARRAREILRATREQLELEKARGEIVSKNLVRHFAEAVGRNHRDASLAWCSRVSALLAGEFGIDPGKLHARLDAEMRAMLRELAETPIREADAVGL